MTNHQTTGKLEAFIENYGNFINDSAKTDNIDVLIKGLSQSIPPPPQSHPLNLKLQDLYKKSQSFSKDSSSDVVIKLKSLKQQKLHDLVVNIEQLNMSLNSEYDRQIKRAVQLGIFTKATQN